MARTIDAQMPVDQNGQTIQVLSFDQGASGKIATVSDTSDGVELDSSIGRKDVVRIACTVDSFVVWGFGSEATATTAGVLFPAGVEYVRVPEGATHISAIRVGSTSGVLCITKAV